MTETVCVIIAAYNSEGSIARAIASALAEPEVTEIIVVDDASTDNTVAAAQSADDGSNRLKILVQPQNTGPSAARNRAIRESHAAWIAVLDADDFFLPGRIKGLLSFSHDMDMVADDMWQVPEDNIHGPKRSLISAPVTASRTISFAEFVLSNVTRSGRQRCELGFIKPLMRRQFLIENTIVYQEHMRLGEDYELYARALALGARLVLVPAQGYVAVVRSNSLSGNHTETDLRHLRDCDIILMNIDNLQKEDKAALRKHYASIDCRLQWRLLIIAVKKRDINKVLLTFLRPFPVPLYLTKQLLLQIFMRSLRTFKILTK